jgi:predicted TIM-barrel fold metal-dependent hydrolase
MIVDAHCHMFNADDLPVDGFVSHHEGLDSFGGRVLAVLVDRIVQGRAPGYREDRARLMALLAPPAGLVPAAMAAPAAEVLDAEVTSALRQLQREDPEFVAQLSGAIARHDSAGVTPRAAAAGQAAAPAFGLPNPAEVKRAIAWAKLFGRSRVQLPADYVRAFGTEVDLCVPMLVDLDYGVADKAKTTQYQQIVLFELLSRAAMRNLLPGVDGMQILPFVGFDPLRQLHEGKSKPIDSPLDVVKDAILRYGFVGIKVYPQMGWKPSGNVARTGLPATDAKALNDIVEELADWCEKNHVPVTAHCNDSNYASPDYKGFGAPEQWLAVLERHKDLHLNLGHFGGAHAKVKEYGWAWTIARAFDKFPYLHCDVGCQRIDQPAVINTYLKVLGEMAAGTDTKLVSERLMFGTDWYLEAINPHPNDFLKTYRERYEGKFGAASTAKFLAGNALHFLGFDDRTNQNARRVAARYRTYKAPVPAWLAT